MNFLDLNIDCLLKIFEYCEITDLESMYQVSTSLRSIVRTSIRKKKCRDLLMTGYMANSSIIERYN